MAFRTEASYMHDVVESIHKHLADIVSHESTYGFVLVLRSEAQIQICEQGSTQIIL